MTSYGLRNHYVNSLLQFPFSSIQPYLIAAAAGIALSLFLLSLKRILWKQFLAWVQTSDQPWETILLNQLRLPLNTLLILISLSLALQLTPNWLRLHEAIPLATKTLFVLSLLWLVSRLLTVTVKFWRPLKSLGDNTHALILVVGRVVLLSLTFLVILDTFGISITPVLASLGVGSIAVALAAQDTLSNFFSGIYILIDEPIRLNDMIRLEGTLEGQVKKIGWRSTHIQSLSNDTIVVPNSKISSAVLTNFNLPCAGTDVSLTVAVDYQSDLEKVEKVALAVGAEVQKRCPYVDASQEPIVRFHTLADSSINFNLTLRAVSFDRVKLVRHEMIKTLHPRFLREKIHIPYPQRVVRQITSDLGAVID